MNAKRIPVPESEPKSQSQRAKVREPEPELRSGLLRRDHSQGEQRQDGVCPFQSLLSASQMKGPWDPLGVPRPFGPLPRGSVGSQIR